MKIRDIESIIKSERPRSAWKRGVQAYAIDLLTDAADCVEDLTPDTAHDVLLNGAVSWQQYSYGGCALIYDGNICKRLCSPSEQYRTKHGQRNPNGRETWLDCQTRALCQAEMLILEVIRNNDTV